MDSPIRNPHNKSGMKRQYYLDNLKIFLTILVVFHHAGQGFLAESYWPWHPADESMYMPWIWHFFSTNAAFFMSLFFFIAGYFVPSSYDRQGYAKFVRKKLLHLGVPCIVFTAIMSVMVGHFEVAHMWFVESLFVFSFLYSLFRVLWKPSEPTCDFRLSIPMLTGISIVMGIVVSIIRQFYAQDYWINLYILNFEPARYFEYVVMFILGLLCCRFKALDTLRNSTGLVFLILGLILACGNYLRADGPWGSFVSRCFGFYESFMCISLSFGLIWLFRDYFNNSNRFLSWLSPLTFGVYLIHLPLMIIFEFAVDSVVMDAFGKFLFIGTVSTIGSFVIVWLLRHIPGVRNVM